ncbi:hypothetical protein SQ03_03900 [Methylobacterium platani JCM 14648]|uniref:Uncharacterized protein n=2 Tax=Methylobacterium platani TaxID=427683 RepID=A0A179SD69_9HYPH|nr:hypothetical protein SQ03_03900 [Methylobacterium platani JCM 14648]OAS24913.1 hypothetical protein A5481_12540 [Methylobacterium platani]
MDSAGGVALLEKARLVENQDGIRLGQGHDHVLTHTITQGVGVPLAAPEHRLLTPWSGIAGGFGPHPAGLAPFHPEQAVEECAG